MNIELGKDNRLKAMRMMENHTWNKLTVSMNQDKAWKQKAFAKIKSKKKQKSIMQTNSIG